MRRFEASPRRATPKGQPSSAAQQRLKPVDLHQPALLIRGTPLHHYAAPTVELHDGELEVRYQPMLGAYEELAALANAEQQCCSFVKWSVAEVAGRPVLRVIAPPTAPEAVEPIAALFKATRSSRKLSQ